MSVVPRCAYATRELAIVARDLRDGRAAGDPPMVAAGKLTEAQAADRLRVATALATDWTCYAEIRLPPLDGATSAEKEAMLARSLTVIAARRDKAHGEMLAELPAAAKMERPELWALVDANRPHTQRAEAWLHWDSYAAAIEAMLWWQRRTGAESKRWLVETTIQLRVRAAAGQVREAA